MPLPATGSDAPELGAGTALRGGHQVVDAAAQRGPRRDLLADPLLGFLLGGREGQDLGRLALPGLLRLLLQAGQAGLRLAQVLTQLLHLGLGLQGGAAQLVGLQARRGGQQAQVVEGLLVLRDLPGQLRILVTVGEVGRGVREHVGERFSREDLLEQGGVLRPVRLGEPPAEGLAPSLQVILAVGELLLQQAEREVGLALLVHELSVALLDAVQPLLDLLDALLDGRLVGADVGQLFLRGGQRVPRRGLLSLEVLHEPFRPCDGRRQLRLAVLGRGDLVLEAGRVYRGRGRHRHHQEQGEHEHGEQGPGHTGPVRACGHARHDRLSTPILLPERSAPGTGADRHSRLRSPVMLLPLPGVRKPDGRAETPG